VSTIVSVLVICAVSPPNKRPTYIHTSSQTFTKSSANCFGGPVMLEMLDFMEMALLGSQR
jgi:hypothetical protein